MPAFAYLPLLAPRLRLCHVEPADAPALFAPLSNSQVMRYWGSPAWTEPARAEQSIARGELGLADGS